MSGAAYDLFTVDGVKVGSGFFSAEGNISTANLKSGVYVVKATKNGKSQSMKISVNKSCKKRRKIYTKENHDNKESPLRQIAVGGFFSTHTKCLQSFGFIEKTQ